MQNEEVLISVIIPVYNSEIYIERCLNSIIRNTYKNLEIICINDGSTDASLEILRKAAGEDRRIIIVNQKENKGVSAARNVGLQVSRGEVIGFVDSDDWIHPRYFELLLSALLENHADAAVCDMEKCSQYDDTYKEIGGKSKISLIPQSDIGINYCVKSYAAGRLYLKSKIGGERFREDLRLQEDTLFNMTVALKKQFKIIFLNETVYFYFQHGESAVHRISADDLLKSSVYYLEKIDAGELSESGKRIFSIETLKNLLAYRYLTMFESDRAKVSSRCKYGFRQCWSVIDKKKLLNGKERFIYSLLTFFPCLYRIYRIYNDRTMLVWEKNQKKLRK